MDAPLSHPLFRRYGPQQVIDDPQFDLVCPECGKPGHAGDHDPRMCILEMWRRDEVKSFNDWAPLARALGEKLRAEARAFLAAPAVVAPHVCSEAGGAAGAAAPVMAHTPAAAPRKCSLCRQPGHTKRTCTAQAAQSALRAPPPLTWEKVVGGGHHLPPDRYYLSDLCYALPDKTYHAVWGKQFNYASGVYRRSDGAVFAVYNTAYGDGGYKGSNDHEYGVDAGVLAVTSERLMGDHEPYGGTWHDFRGGEVSFTQSGGIFVLLGPGEEVRIDTAGFDEEDKDK